MFQSHEEQNHRELMLMPLLFTSYDTYLQSLKSFQEGLNWMEDLKICQKPTKHGQLLFCEAVEQLNRYKVLAETKNSCPIGFLQ
jgi:hypothetical protein